MRLHEFPHNPEFFEHLDEIIQNAEITPEEKEEFKEKKEEYGKMTLTAFKEFCDGWGKLEPAHFLSDRAAENFRIVQEIFSQITDKSNFFVPETHRQLSRPESLDNRFLEELSFTFGFMPFAAQYLILNSLTSRELEERESDVLKEKISFYLREIADWRHELAKIFSEYADSPDFQQTAARFWQIFQKELEAQLAYYQSHRDNFRQVYNVRLPEAIEENAVDLMRRNRKGAIVEALVLRLFAEHGFATGVYDSDLDVTRGTDFITFDIHSDPRKNGILFIQLKSASDLEDKYIEIVDLDENFNLDNKYASEIEKIKKITREYQSYKKIPTKSIMIRVGKLPNELVDKMTGAMIGYDPGAKSILDHSVCCEFTDELQPIVEWLNTQGGGNE